LPLAKVAQVPILRYVARSLGTLGHHRAYHDLAVHVRRD
jgi:hypothetical protein